MKLVQVHDLVPGMVLAEDIYGKFDLLYASKGDLLTEKTIEGVHRLGLQTVYIVDDSSPIQTIVQQNLATPVSGANDPLAAYQDVITFMKQSYENFKLLNKEVISKIKAPISKLEALVYNSEPILKQLNKLKAVDGYTLSHSIQVSALSALIGSWLELSDEDQYKLAFSGLLHDLGKIKIPPQILSKPSRLTPDEFETIKKHAEYTIDIIKGLPEISDDIIAAVMQHHEKNDGSGYPAGLAEEEIHYYAQIICIADIYAAMTSDKVYNRKITPLKATEEVFNVSFGKKVNAEIANLFLKHIYRLLVGTRVKLNDGKEGEIVYFNKFSPSKPLVKMDDESFIDLYKTSGLYIEEIL